MRFSDKTKVYKIEKSLREAVLNEGDTVNKLVEKLLNQVSQTTFIAAGLMAGYRTGKYEKEIRAIANDADVSESLLIGANLIYDLSHIQSIGIGCSSAVRYTEEHGMVHMRCLDWDITELGRFTRVFESPDFMMVGLPGFSGALSGMVYGKFSVTMNWAPPEDTPILRTTGYSPPFLLREVLEKARTFDAALEMLSKTCLSGSVFFTLCGTKKGQACLIERTTEGYNIIPMGRSGVLAQTNHFQTKEYRWLNEDNGHDEDGDIYNIAHSKLRASKLEKSVSKLGELKDLASYRKPLTLTEVENGDTCQQMVFAPAKSEYRLWRKT